LNMLVLLASAALTLVVTVLLYILQPYFASLGNSKCEYRVEELKSRPSTRSSSDIRSTAPSTAQSNDTLSIVIPAYNEEKRLPSTLESTTSYLSQTPHLPTVSKISIIVVDDGSTDATSSVVKSWSSALTPNSRVSSVTLCTHVVNSGKGSAIKSGCLCSSPGSYLLMLDADGATDVEEIGKVWGVMKVVVGSRAWMKEESKATRTLLRTFLMHAFHMFVSFLVSRNINDTQCGFKLFNPVSKRGGIEGLHLRRWAFDVEVVVRCEMQGYTMKEVPVKWQEIEGSKLTEEGFLGLVKNGVGMLRDMICVRLCYVTGGWKVGDEEKKEKKGD